MSTMTAQATQVYSVFVRATPEQLWDAITKPEFTSKYFYGSVIDSTWEPGAPSRAGRATARSSTSTARWSRLAAAAARHDLEGALRPRDRSGAVQPRHLGDRTCGRRRHEAHRRPRRARGLAEDGRERRERLELRAQRPENAARDGRAARPLARKGTRTPGFSVTKPGVRAVLVTGFAALLLALPASASDWSPSATWLHRRAAFI